MKYWLLALPILTMLFVGWYNVSVIQSDCVNSTDPACNVDISGSVLGNPVSWLLSSWQPSQSTNVGCGQWGAFIPFTNVCTPIPTMQQVATAIGNGGGSGSGQSVLFGLVGLAMIVFALLANTSVLGTSLNLTDTDKRLLYAMGMGYMIWAFVTVFALTAPTGITPIIYKIPYGFGAMLVAGLTIIYSLGIYDLARSIT